MRIQKSLFPHKLVEVLSGTWGGSCYKSQPGRLLPGQPQLLTSTLTMAPLGFAVSEAS